MKAKVNKVTIRIVSGKLISTDAQGIVHDTDSALSVSDWLLQAAGEEVLRELDLIGWCDIGSAVITTAGKLAARKIIHVVGPRWGDASARGKLANATWEVLRLAEDNQLQSIAIPAISTGAAGGYPVENCAKTMLEQIIDFTFEPLRYLRQVVICLETEHALFAFENEFARQLEALKANGDGKIRA